MFSDFPCITLSTKTAHYIYLIYLCGTKIIPLCLYFSKPWISFTRVRRSSTSSSRHALENSGPADTMTSEGLGLEEEVNADMFAIEDDDEREDAEGYYYDEVFGQSPFRDQRTNSTTRYLTEDSTPGSTRDDVTRHDMDFETLGIKIDDYKIDPNLKYSI